MPTKLCLISANALHLKVDAIATFVTPEIVHVDGTGSALCTKAGEELHLCIQRIKEDLSENKLPKGDAVCTPSFKLTNCNLIIHAAGPQIPQKRKPTRTEEHDLRLAVMSSLRICNEEGILSLGLILPSACGLMNYPTSEAFFIVVQSVLVFLETLSDVSLNEILIVVEHDSVRKVLLEENAGFDAMEINTTIEAFEYRSKLESQRNLPKQQRSCIPISENVSVSSLVKKWQNSNEGNRIRNGQQYIRDMANKNYAEKRLNPSFLQSRAAKQKANRENYKRQQKLSETHRSQNRRENDDFRLQENESRQERRSANIVAERETQRLQKQQVRDHDVLMELRKQSAELRSNPLKRRFSQLARKISRKKSIFEPDALISALPPTRQAQYRIKAKEIRNRKSRLQSKEIDRMSKNRRTIVLERRMSASKNVKEKYGILRRLSNLVPKRMSRLITNCQHQRGTDFPEMGKCLIKRKRLLVNYFSSRNTYNPSTNEIIQARTEIDGLYFAGKRIAEEVEKKIERIRAILVHRSQLRSTRTALTDEQNDILAIAGVHVHVRSHEGNLLKDKDSYEKVKPFYTNFGAEMREKGYRAPERSKPTDELIADSSRKLCQDEDNYVVDINRKFFPDSIGVDDIPLVSIQNHDSLDIESINSDESTAVSPSAPPLEDISNEIEKHISVADQPDDTVEESSEDPETWMRGEDDKCFAMLPERNWAVEIRIALAGLENVPSSKLLRHLESMERCRKCDQSLCLPKNCSNFLNLLKLLSPHFMAIRTIIRRYFELKEYLRWKKSWDSLEATEKATYVMYKNLISVESIPREIGKRIVLQQSSEVDFSHHTEHAVLLNFGKQIKRFRAAVADTEKFDCASCNRMMKASKVKRVAVNDPDLPDFILPPKGKQQCDVPFEVLESSDEAEETNEVDEHEEREHGAGHESLDGNTVEKIIICHDCMSELKQGRMPPLCVQNGLYVDELPKELQGLHWLEYAVIRKIRPLISKFQLENARGTKKGTFGGYKSTVLHFPVPIDGTMKKTLSDMDKLPSMEHVDIAVLVTSRNGKENKYSFNMKKVIAALQWLKKNNPLYSDVEIDQEAKSIRDVLRKYNFDCENENNDDDNRDEINKDSRVNNFEDQENQDIEEGVSKKSYMLTQLPDPSHIAHTNVDVDPPNRKASDLYLKLKDHTGDPLKTNTIDHLEAKSFPVQFPLGRGDFDTPRPVPISKTVYVHNRVRNADPRFRQADYACHLNNERDVHTMLSSCNFSAKKTMSAGTLHSLVNKEELDEDVYSNFSALKGSDGFWKERRMEVNAAIEMLGPATFFFTLNPAEGEWAELRSLYEQRYPHLAAEKTNTEFCSLDPLIFTRHFQHRVEAAYKHLIGPKGVLGPVKDYWRRIEYQRRGAPHCHGLIWIDGAPTIGTASDEELVKFIDKYITTRMPDPIAEPNLFQAVNKHQIHRCTDSCLSQYKKGRTKLQKCRFGHPFNIQLETEMLHKKDEDDPRARQKNYIIRRLYNALRINPYNPAVLLAWDGNIDIQFVSENSLNTVRYVTGYVAKGETKAITTDALAGAECLTKKDLVKQAMLLLRQREMGMPEVYSRLLGQHLYDASFSVKFLNTNEKDKRVRMMKSKAEIAKLTKDDKITQNNIVDDYYPNRPKELEKRCLYNVFAALEFSKKRPRPGKENKKSVITMDEFQADEEVSENDMELGDENQNHSAVDKSNTEPTPLQLLPPKSVFKIGKNFGYFRAKTKLKIVRFFLNDLNGEDKEVEDYCRRCLLLFKPWRIEEKDLKGAFETFQEAFQDFMAKCSANQRKEIFMLLKGKQEMLEAMKENVARAEKRKLTEEDDEEEGPVMEIPAWNVTEESLRRGIEMLNEKQNEAFLDITKTVDEGNPEGKNFFISGVAGTGKSHVIKTLTDYIYLKYAIPGKETTSPPVLLGAPTGKAALNIHGLTVHTLLGLGVEKGRTASFVSLKAKKLHELRTLFTHCKVLFIDEVSMVSNVMLMMIHRRLQEIKGNTNELFGGIMVVAFGDLLQLPPVRLPPVYQSIRKDLLNQIFKTVKINFNLWENAFEYFELTENMRQKEELDYANMLNRFRTASPNDKDFETLFERYVSVMLGQTTEGKIPKGSSLDECGKYFVQLLEVDPSAIAVFGYTKAVTAFNNFVMECRRENLGLPIVEIPAIQGPLSRKVVVGKLQRPFLRKENRHTTFLSDKTPVNTPVQLCADLDDDAKRSGGLSKLLRLQVGARVMLTRNVPQRQQEGLVNGAMGTLEEIITVDGEVQLLRIKFDKIEKTQLIKRDFAAYDVGEQLTSSRRQFSVAVAYAQTVHKSQGDTVRNVMVDLYSLFDSGQAYVALSRSTSIKGLHVIDFHPQALKCSESAVKEYNRLRQMIGMDPLPEPNKKPPITGLFAKYSKDWATHFANREDFAEANEHTIFVTADKEVVPKINELRGKKASAVKNNKKPWSATLLQGNRYKPSSKKKNQQSISHNGLSVDLIIQKSKPILKIVTKKKAEAKKAAVISSFTGDRDALLLENTANHCFINAVVQAVRRCWAPEVLARGGVISRALTRLQGLIGSPGLKSVRGLLKYTDRDGFFADGRQHCAGEYFLELVRKIDILAIDQSIKHKTKEVISCQCGYANVSENDEQIVRVQTDLPLGTLDDYFATIEADEILEEARCPDCDSLNSLVKKTELDIQGCNNLVVLFNMADNSGDRMKIKRHIDLPPFPHRFKGTLWNLLALVEHKGPFVGQGHYVTWTKKDEKWLCHDDTVLTEHQELPLGIPNSVLMFFESA